MLVTNMDRPKRTLKRPIKFTDLSDEEEDNYITPDVLESLEKDKDADYEPETPRSRRHE